MTGIICGVCGRDVAIGRLFFRVGARGDVCARCVEAFDLYDHLDLPGDGCPPRLRRPAAPPGVNVTDSPLVATRRRQNEGRERGLLPR